MRDSSLLGSLCVCVLALGLTGCPEDTIPLPDTGPPLPDAGAGDAGPPTLTCDNNELDGDETSIDCGGSCDPCPNGENCNGAEDCQSLVCNRGRCLVPNCRDGVRNGEETGADCGGDCGLCPGGEPCSSNDQCLSGRCRAGTCTMSDCEDGTQNGTETDVDCGGDTCLPCRGGFFCMGGLDCESLICSMGTCTDAACNDGVQNQDETSVDCGGSLCPGCREGLACQIDADCLMNRCFDGGCVSCVDRIMNAEETGVDCGGGGMCPACPDGQGCVVDADCANLRCFDTSGDMTPDTCISCADGVMNAEETDLDCGGPLCGGCANGLMCNSGTDCISNDCQGGRCIGVADTCSDVFALSNGANSVDWAAFTNDYMTARPTCSFSTATGPDIVMSFTATVNGFLDYTILKPSNNRWNFVISNSPCGTITPELACSSEFTAGEITGTISITLGQTYYFYLVDTTTGTAPLSDPLNITLSEVDMQCRDFVRNGLETDVDCGGGVCPACSDGQMCSLNGDCSSSSCSGGLCVSCLDNVRNQDETDVDCGGTSCLACGPGFLCNTGADCASTVCTAGRCVGLSPNPTFQVVNFTDLACSTVDHNSLSGDDRGGIGISDSTVMYTGDTATVRYGLDLSGGTALFPATGLSGAGRDAMVTNMANGQIYILTNAGTPLPWGGGVITQLVPMNDDGSLSTTGRITLSVPIVATSSTFGAGVGIFAGHNRVVIHNGSSVQSIAIPSGAVTNLGAMTRPLRRTCENWAYYGIAETDGVNTNLVYVQSPTAIVKTRVPTGATVGTFPFTNLGDVCVVTGNLMRNRWYFQYEFSNQFGGSAETIGYCPATYSTAGGNFLVTSMGATGCQILDYGFSFVGDDRGGIAANNTYVYYNGDSALGRWSGLDLSGGINSGTVGIQHDALVSDIRTGRSYQLASAAGVLVRSPAGGTVTRLIQLDPVTGLQTATEITLSAPITLPSFNVGIFSGWNRIILHDGTSAYRIQLPAGTVTNLGAMPSPPHQGCESWAYWGIAEFFGGADHVIAATTADDLVRYAVPGGGVEMTWPFSNLGDMCSVTFSPHTNRWYFHHEGTSQLTVGSSLETLGHCRAVYGNP